MKRADRPRHYHEDDIIYDIGYRESELGDKLYKQCNNIEDEDNVDDLIDAPPHITNYLLKWQETHWDEGPWSKPQLANEDTCDFNMQLRFDDEHVEKNKTNELIF